MARHWITHDQVVYKMDKTNPPVVEVDPGDVVFF